MNEVTTYYLEMKSPSSLKEKTESNGLHVHECEIKQFQVNRFFYQLVGGPWEWTNKLSWPDEQWRAHVENDNLRTWFAHYKGSPAGYYELPKTRGRQCRNRQFRFGSPFYRTGLWRLFLISCNKIGMAVGKSKKSMGAYLYS